MDSHEDYYAYFVMDIVIVCVFIAQQVVIVFHLHVRSVLCDLFDCNIKVVKVAQGISQGCFQVCITFVLDYRFK